MMYSEFAEAIGCRDNEYNHRVFANLEVMYMNTDMTKEEIYEYGRKLVNNDKTQDEIELEAGINAKIDEYKAAIEYNKSRIEMYQELLDDEFLFNTESDIKWYKRVIKNYKESNKVYRQSIKELKWVLGR